MLTQLGFFVKINVTEPKTSREAKVIYFPGPVSSDCDGETVILFSRILHAWHFGIDSEAISGFAVELLQKINAQKQRNNMGFSLLDSNETNQIISY